MRSGWLFGVCAVLASLSAQARECTLEPANFDYDDREECFVEEPDPSPFIEREGRIFLKNEGGDVALTEGPEDYGAVLWPDGKGFYYFRGERTSQYSVRSELHSRRLDGTDDQRISDPEWDAGGAVYSLDEKTLYFWAHTNGNHGSVFKVDLATQRVDFFAYASGFFLMKYCGGIEEELRETVVVSMPAYHVFSLGSQRALHVVDKDGKGIGTDTYSGIVQACH